MNTVASYRPSLALRVGLGFIRLLIRFFVLIAHVVMLLHRPVATFAYGNRKSETVHVLPAAKGVEPKDPVLYVHGGGWVIGRKECWSPFLGFLRREGHPVFNLDYPLAPEHPFPEGLRSLLKASAWIYEHYPEAKRVHLMGDSAGGNLAMMLGLLLKNPKLMEELVPDLQGRAFPEVQTVVSLYGVLDQESWVERCFPGAAFMLDCYRGETESNPPLTPVDLDCDVYPRMFIATGELDRLADSSQVAFRHLQGAEADVCFKSYSGESHGFMQLSRRETAEQLRRDILGFLDG